jgi:putative glutamine amidotransferase
LAGFGPYTERMRTPLIAVAGYRLAAGRVAGWDVSAIAVPEYYLTAVRRAGGWPAIVSAPDTEGPGRNADGPGQDEDPPGFDALLLVGGGDVDPTCYGAQPHPEVYGTDQRRDEFEMRLVRDAVAADRPVLAICRGIQVVNVALGGTLHQHLMDLPGAIAHGSPTEADPWVTHELKVSESSRIAEACGRVAFTARASHHQAVDRLGRGLRAVAWTEDGVIEAIEADQGWVVGVQWHPERTAAEDETQQALFDALVQQARIRR